MNLTSIISLLLKFNSNGARDEKKIAPLESLSLVEKVRIPLFVTEERGFEVKMRENFRMKMESCVCSSNAAAYLGFPELLLKNDEGRDLRGCTLLMKACYRGHTDIVKELIKRGLGRINGSGSVFNKGANNVIEKSEQEPSGNPFSKVSSSLDQADYAGNTALIWAIIQNHIHLVKILVDEGGATVNGVAILKEGQIRPRVYMTPLAAACYGGHVEVVEYLLQKGAKINDYIGTKKMTALNIAALMRKKHVVVMLLRHSAFSEPESDIWLSSGIIQLKKRMLENNPWSQLAPEGKPHGGIMQISGTSNLSSRRASLQEKFIYCCMDDIETISEISTLLCANVNNGNSFLTSGISNIPKATSASLSRQSLMKKRNTGFRQGMNLDVFKPLTLENNRQKFNRDCRSC